MLAALMLRPYYFVPLEDDWTQRESCMREYYVKKSALRAIPRDADDCATLHVACPTPAVEPRFSYFCHFFTQQFASEASQSSQARVAQLQRHDPPSARY